MKESLLKISEELCGDEDVDGSGSREANPRRAMEITMLCASVSSETQNHLVRM